MGWSHWRSGTAGRRGTARAALLLVPLALAACGSVVAGNSSGTAGAPVSKAAQQLTLCADAGAVNHLVITRTGILNHALAEPRFTFPGIVTVTSPAQAQAVARALCALPRQPAGIINCPADLGVAYQLRFAAPGRHFAVVKVEASGCQVVSGIGKARTISGAPGFWAVLGRAMRLHGPAAQGMFRGTVRAGKHCPPSAMMAQPGGCKGPIQSG